MEKFYVLEDYSFADGRTDKQYFPYESEMEAMSAIHDHYNSITDVLMSRVANTEVLFLYHLCGQHLWGVIAELG